MGGLPEQVNFTAGAGGEWAQTFSMPSVDITGLDWEFVIRPNVTDATQPPLVKVTTVVGTQGYITVDTAGRTVQVVLTPAATTLLGKGARPYALWSNPGTSQATPWADGTFNTQLVAAP